MLSSITGIREVLQSRSEFNSASAMSFNTQEFVDFLNRADQGLKDLEKKLASGDTKTVIPSFVQTNLMNESFVKIRRR